jgi:hypothetical protein
LIVQDAFAPEVNTPVIDTSQDLVQLFGQQTDAYTAFVFKRRIDLCSYQDVPINPAIPFYMIFALGTDNNFRKHGPLDNGHKLIDLSLNYFPAAPATSEVVTTFNLSTPRVEVPTNTETVYCYSIHKVSRVGKQHISRVRPILNQ